MKIFFSTLSLLCILGLLPLHATETLAETIDALPVTNYYKITAITGQINATVREAWDDATLISRVQCRVTYSIFHTSTKKQETRYATQTWQISVKDSGEHLFQLSDFKKVAVLGKIVFQCVPVFKSEDTT
ncbi:MAG: hypothetical protein ABIP97_02875, partial [Chthoniobacterales bacterium]